MNGSLDIYCILQRHYTRWFCGVKPIFGTIDYVFLSELQHLRKDMAETPDSQNNPKSLEIDPAVAFELQKIKENKNLGGPAKGSYRATVSLAAQCVTQKLSAAPQPKLLHPRD